MPLNIDITRDPYFKRGELRGLKRGEKLGEKRSSKKIALKMLKDTELSNEEIAYCVDLTLEEVAELKKQLLYEN